MMAAMVPAPAVTIAYTDPAGAGNQSWAGNLALDFTVNSPITVSGNDCGHAASGDFQHRHEHAGHADGDVSWVVRANRF